MYEWFYKALILLVYNWIDVFFYVIVVWRKSS